jgi:hypothetical protein
MGAVPVSSDDYPKRELGVRQMIERDKWLYVWAGSPEKAREFFELPEETECHLHEVDGDRRCWAVKAPTPTLPYFGDNAESKAEI